MKLKNVDVFHVSKYTEQNILKFHFFNEVVTKYVEIYSYTGNSFLFTIFLKFIKISIEDNIK